MLTTITVNDQLVARCQTAAGSRINAEGPTAFCQIHACLQLTPGSYKRLGSLFEMNFILTWFHVDLAIYFSIYVMSGALCCVCVCIRFLSYDGVAH